MIVYLRRRPLLLFSVAHTNIPRCACPCAMLFASPAFTGGLLWQAYLCSQPKLQKGGGLAAAAATALYCGRRCTSAPSQSYRRGGDLAAAAATALYCGRRCTSAPSQSYRRGGGLVAAAATALYCRRRCSVARTVSHDNYDYRCITAETAGYAPRTSSPRARLVGIARTRFPTPGRRNVAPVAVAADKTTATVVDDCAAELVVVPHNLPS